MNDMLLRLGRVTRFLPRVPVIWFHNIYRRTLNPLDAYRISDFDGDLKLDVQLTNSAGASLWHAPHRVDKQERRLFCAAITPGCTVLDVGANIGIYTLLAAKRGAKVFAIEADPRNADMLRHHVQLNGFDASVTVTEMAALDHEGLVGLRRNPFNAGGSTVIAGADIPAHTIDSLNLPPIDLCKMDIECSELRALRGMQETIKRSPRLKLLIESNALNCGDQGRLLEFLRLHFARVCVAGQPHPLSGDPPRFCNLWCAQG